MYLCFEHEDKRMAFPEASLITADENGFTMRSAHNARTGDTLFVKMAAFKGTVADFRQAMQFIKRADQKTAK